MAANTRLEDEDGLFDLELHDDAESSHVSETPPVSLPSDALCLIFQSGHPPDWAVWATISREASYAVESIRSACRSLSLPSVAALGALRPTLSRLRGLRHLLLPGSASTPGALLSDDGLAVLAEELPLLEELELPSQTQLTNKGIRRAALFFADSLRSIDITCCNLIGYGAVEHLRQTCHRLETIRRLPAWMVGWALTPDGERHTYYADGSFSFDRDEESRGWVAQLRLMEEGCVETRLVYIDIDATGPASHNGRVGVLVRPEGGREDAAAATAVVAGAATPSTLEALVLQSLRVPEPPYVWPRMGEESLPATGQTRQFRKLCGGVMISRLELHLLPPDEQNPPAELVAQLTAFCDEHPVRRREYERRALRSMVDRRKGGERVASVMSMLAAALSPPEPSLPHSGGESAASPSSGT